MSPDEVVPDQEDRKVVAVILPFLGEGVRTTLPVGGIAISRDLDSAGPQGIAELFQEGERRYAGGIVPDRLRCGACHGGL